MKRFVITCLLLSLSLSSGCTASGPKVVVQKEFVRAAVPPALITPCDREWRKAVRVTGDFIVRGDHNEAALKNCAAKIEGVRRWSNAQAGG